jgi:Cu/Ag efflux protein CusF
LFSDGAVSTMTLTHVFDAPCPRDDGQRLVLGASNEGMECISIYDVTSATTQQLSCSAHAAVYAADNRTLVFSRHVDTSSDEVVTMSDDGASMHVLVPASPNRIIRDPAFSFDGVSVVFAYGTVGGDGFASNWDIDVIDRSTHALTTITSVVGDMSTSSPRFTPDGTGIAFVTAATDPSNYAVKLVDVATGKVRVLIENLDELKLGFVGPQFTISLAPDP